MPDKNAGAVAWIAEHAPTEAALVTAMRAMLDEHDHWDSLHEFRLLVVDEGGDLTPVTVAALDTAIPPPSYGRVLRSITADMIAGLIAEHPETPPAVACMLQIEAFSVTTNEHGDLTDEESAAFARREARTLPNAREQLWILAADIMGRTWSITKFRGTGGEPDQITGASDTRASGSFADVVRDCAALAPQMYTAAAASFWTREDDHRA